MNSEILFGVMIPFIGTTLGAACVYIMRNELKDRVQKGLSGFAAGVMVAAHPSGPSSCQPWTWSKTN